MSARARCQAVQTDEPLRLFAIAADDGIVRNGHGGALAFTEHGLAQRSAGDQHRVVEFIEVRQPPERETPWGEGQHDHVQLSAGVSAALRITPEGRVKLTIPGGELDVTDGGTTLGLGLCEAGARAAQIRVARLECARRRGAKPMCGRCGRSLFGYVDHAGQPSYPQCPRREDGLLLCVPAEGESPRAPRRRP